MSGTLKYTCPVHPDVVLFKKTKEDATTLRMILPETPEYCPKCDKFYYKHECKVKNE